MSTRNTHVPKFGNWDGSVPYTQYFETARKERSGGKVNMNPNDPLDNPEAFQTEMPSVHGPYSEATNLHNHRHNDQTTSGNYQRRKSRHSTSEGLSGCSHALVSNSPGRLRMTNSQDENRQVKVMKGSPVPKFGDWDESDPSSADGFTGIFDTVREDKQQTSSAKVSSVSSEKAYPNAHQRTHVDSHGCWWFGCCKK